MVRSRLPKIEKVLQDMRIRNRLIRNCFIGITGKKHVISIDSQARPTEVVFAISEKSESQVAVRVPFHVPLVERTPD